VFYDELPSSQDMKSIFTQRGSGPRIMQGTPPDQ